MLLAIDGLAERYGMLPSQILHHASTFDIYVLNAAAMWRNRQRQLSDAGATQPVPHLSQDELKNIWANFKEMK